MQVRPATRQNGWGLELKNAIKRDEIAAREAHILEMTSLVEVAF